MQKIILATVSGNIILIWQEMDNHEEAKTFLIFATAVMFMKYFDIIKHKKQCYEPYHAQTTHMHINFPSFNSAVVNK